MIPDEPKTITGTPVPASSSVRSPNEPSAESIEPTGGSVNEPTPPAAGGEEEVEDDPLPSEEQLMAMTRAQLDALANERGLDTSSLATKADVVDALQEDAEA